MVPSLNKFLDNLDAKLARTAPNARQANGGTVYGDPLGTAQHLRWMIAQVRHLDAETIMESEWGPEKLNAWIGAIQGLASGAGVTGIGSLRHWTVEKITREHDEQLDREDAIRAKQEQVAESKADEEMFGDEDPEKVAEYKALLADGLSDYEARGTVWPDDEDEDGNTTASRDPKPGEKLPDGPLVSPGDLGKPGDAKLEKIDDHAFKVGDVVHDERDDPPVPKTIKAIEGDVAQLTWFVGDDLHDDHTSTLGLNLAPEADPDATAEGDATEASE